MLRNGFFDPKIQPEVDEWSLKLRYAKFATLPDKHVKLVLNRLSPASFEPLCLVYQQGVPLYSEGSMCYMFRIQISRDISASNCTPVCQASSIGQLQGCEGHAQTSHLGPQREAHEHSSRTRAGAHVGRSFPLVGRALPTVTLSNLVFGGRLMPLDASAA